MLQYELTPRHAGIVLWGDSRDLDALYDMVFEVADGSPLLSKHSDSMLGLCYEIRHAKQGDRKKGYYSANGDEDRVRIYGAPLLWPHLLSHVALLRNALGCMPNTHLQQSLMYGLEHITRSALDTLKPGLARQVDHGLGPAFGPSCCNVDAVFERLHSRCEFFINLPTRKRIDALPCIMHSFTPSYDIMYDAWRHAGATDLIDPAAFARFENIESEKINW